LVGSFLFAHYARSHDEPRMVAGPLVIKQKGSIYAKYPTRAEAQAKFDAALNDGSVEVLRSRDPEDGYYEE
jgi:hypothetical protein